jgi:hypothetical protein
MSKRHQPDHPEHDRQLHQWRPQPSDLSPAAREVLEGFKHFSLHWVGPWRRGGSDDDHVHMVILTDEKTFDLGVYYAAAMLVAGKKIQLRSNDAELHGRAWQKLALLVGGGVARAA